MRIVTRELSGEVFIDETFVARVLELTTVRVKVGIRVHASPEAARRTCDPLSQVQCTCRGYYCFSPATDRSLILELHKGQRVVINDTAELVVLNLRLAGATFVVCSGHDERPASTSPVAIEELLACAAARREHS